MGLADIRDGRSMAELAQLLIDRAAEVKQRQFEEWAGIAEGDGGPCATGGPPVLSPACVRSPRQA